MKRSFSALLSVSMLSSSLGLTACTNSAEKNQEMVKQEIQKRIAESVAKPKTVAAGSFSEVSFDQKKDISVNVVNAPFMQIIEQSAARFGWTIKVMDGVDPSKKISLSEKNTDVKSLITDAAFAAGYVAIIKDDTVIITDKATYTFRVPASLLVDQKTEVDVGGNPAKLTSGGGGSSGGAGGMAGGAQAKPQGIDSLFKVNMKYDGVKSEFKQSLEDIAGPNSQIKIVGDIGLITMRGNAQSLARVHQYINEISKQSLTVINMEVAIIEVALTGDMQYGINWNNIKLDSMATASMTGGSVYASGANGLVGSYSEPNGMSGIISALQKRTSVNVMFTQNTSTANDKSAVLFDGKQIPYLGSVTPANTGGFTSTTGAAMLSFATDGLMLSVRPSVMNDGQTIMFSIVPIQTTVNGLTSFDAGNGIKLQGPNQSVKQSFVEAFAQDGETMIMAGSKTRSNQTQQAGIPGLIDAPFLSELTGGTAKSDIDREVVILLTPRIQKAPKNFDTLINASI